MENNYDWLDDLKYDDDLAVARARTRSRANRYCFTRLSADIYSALADINFSYELEQVCSNERVINYVSILQWHKKHKKILKEMRQCKVVRKKSYYESKKNLQLILDSHFKMT